MTRITDHLRDTARTWATPQGAAAIALTLLLARLDGPAFAVAAAVAVPMCASALSLWKNFHKYRATHEALVSGGLEMRECDFRPWIGPGRPPDHPCVHATQAIPAADGGGGPRRLRFIVP